MQTNDSCHCEAVALDLIGAAKVRYDGGGDNTLSALGKIHICWETMSVICVEIWRVSTRPIQIGSMPLIIH